MAKSRIIAELSADEKKFVEGMRRAITENAKLKSKLQELANQGRKTKTQSDRIGGALEKAFSPATLSTLIGTLGGVGGAMSLQGALSGVIGLASQARDEIKGIAEGLQETYKGSRDLWQISRGARDYNQLSQQVKLAMASEGVTREQGQSLLFNLRSLGRESALMPLVKASRFIAPDVAGQFYTTVTSDVNWGRALGSPERVLSALLAGAGQSKWNAQQTADIATRTAPMLRQLGTTLPELLGVAAAGSTGAVRPELEATYMRAVGTVLYKWREEARAGKPLADLGVEPTAPVAPEHKPPKMPDRLYSSGMARINAERAHRERLARYEEDYAEKVTEYKKKQADYEEKHAAWLARREQATKVIEAATGATGFLGTLRAMREVDPESYKAAKMSQRRFALGVTPLEGKTAAGESVMDQAQRLTDVVGDALKSDELYRRRLATPRRLTEQRQAIVAEQQKTVALDERARKELRLQTAINQYEAIVGSTGGSLTAAKAWESLLGQEATLGSIEFATQQARQGTIAAIRTARPDVYQRRLAARFPLARPPASTVPTFGAPGLTEPARPAVSGAALSRDDLAALDQAIRDMIMTNSENRNLTRDMLEEMKNMAADTKRTADAIEGNKPDAVAPLVPATVDR